MNTLYCQQTDIKLLAKLLQQGQVIAFPTETVYGLGVVFDNEKAFQEMVQVKRRPADKPFTLMCDSIEQIRQYAVTNPKIDRLIDAYMPGPLTIVMKVQDHVPSWVSLNTGSIGIRISSLPFVRELIAATGKPLLVPSANKAGDPPALNGETALSIFNHEIAAVVAGESISNVPSTVIAASDKLTLLRAGSIPFADLEKIWEE